LIYEPKQTPSLFPNLVVIADAALSGKKKAREAKEKEHTTLGIRWSSPTQLLI
jgi:hypothetical protein